MISKEGTSIRNHRKDLVSFCCSILFISFILFFFVQDSEITGAEVDRRQVIIETNDIKLQIVPTSKTVQMFTIQSTLNVPLTLRQFQVERINNYIYQIRHATWKKFFWQIDTERKRVYRVINGTFGVMSSEGTRLVNIMVYPLGSSDDASRVIVLLPAVCLISYSPAVNSLTFSINEDEVSSSLTDWEVVKVDANNYHVRPYKALNTQSFWRIDTALKKLFEVKPYGKFGSANEIGSPLGWKLQTLGFDKSSDRVEATSTAVAGQTATGRDLAGPKGDMIRSSENGILDDASSKPYGLEPKSQWTEKAKKINRELLSRDEYDVLVLPFQVQGYGIDRIGRSLMTRYLVHALETATDLRMPSPTLVARAMGELTRRFKQEDIYQLANDLNVKTLIQGYVGHDREGKMKLTLLIQRRDKHMPLDPATPLQKLDWNEIPFSDERPPSEVFCSLLDDIMSKLPIKQEKKRPEVFYEEEKQLGLPASMMDLVDKKPGSPVAGAYYLQMLGALYPAESPSRDDMFERSLVALRDISAMSPDYQLLKSRAYFYLYRRPAALTALKKAGSPEEKALVALLDGNLSEMEISVNEIKRPIPRLLAEIELNDLEWAYGNEVRAKNKYKAITQNLSAWEMVVTRRLQRNDHWKIQSNLDVKKALDLYFPLPDFTVKDIRRASAAVGEDQLESDDILFSVYNHYQRILVSQAKRFVINESTSVVMRDLLDLLDRIGEANLVEKARLRIVTQALPEDGLALLDRYERLYSGHPEMTQMKSAALHGIAKKNQGNVKENLRSQAIDVASAACYLFQGQTFLGRISCSSSDMFDGDYPRRPYWNYGPNRSLPGDRISIKSDYIGQDTSTLVDYLRKDVKNLDVALRYTTSDFSYLESYYELLIAAGLDHEAEDLVSKNQARFQGDPAKSLFYAKLREKINDPEEAKAIYEEGIKASPETWNLYARLAELYIRLGEFQKASETYTRYPFFKMSDDKDVDTVTVSNSAEEAGSKLWWVGAIDEALPFFSLSARLDTGSRASMSSLVRLLLVEGKYTEATQASLELAKRYDNISDYSGYVTLLHLSGYHDEAWSIANKLGFANNLLHVPRSITVAHRLEGMTEEEQRQWLLKQNLQNNKLADIQSYVVSSNFTDRKPDESLPDFIDNISKLIDPAAATKGRSEPSWFIDAYNNIRRRQYAKASVIFAEKFDNNKHYYYPTYALSYYAYAAVNNNNAAQIENSIKLHKERCGEDFDYHLAQAILNNNKRDYKQAIKQLQAAQGKLPSNKRLIFPWYQLIETCEWLYGDSGYEGYRDLIVKWAKICQKIRYEYSWPYAMEAKYTSSATDRIRALGITLYLDKRSDRISNIPDEEKKRALEWLEISNPFLAHSQFRGVKRK